MYCPKCGAENQENSKFCQNCGNKLNLTNNSQDIYQSRVSDNTNDNMTWQNSTSENREIIHSQNGLKINKKNKSKKKKGCLTFICIVCALLLMFLFIGLFSSDDDTINDDTTNEKTTTSSVSTTEKKEETEKQYKDKCNIYDYKEIARYPDKYNGTRMKFVGKVIQVDTTAFSKNKYYARVNVTKDDYGYYEDTIYVTFTLEEGAPKILEDDIIEIYGECTGEHSYVSVLGQSITIPSVDGKYVEIVK